MTATYTVECDGCGDATDAPIDCEHGRCLCATCVSGFAPCHHCVSEARDA